MGRVEGNVGYGGVGACKLEGCTSFFVSWDVDGGEGCKPREVGLESSLTDVFGEV